MSSITIHRCLFKMKIDAERSKSAIQTGKRRNFGGGCEMPTNYFDSEDNSGKNDEKLN